MRICAAEYVQGLMMRTESLLQRNVPSSQIRKVRTADTSESAALVHRADLKGRRPAATPAEAQWIRAEGEEACRINTTITMHRTGPTTVIVDGPGITTGIDPTAATKTDSITEMVEEELEEIHIVHRRGKKKDV